MPEWLLKQENYMPQLDKDTFVNKSILSLLVILSRMRFQSNSKTEKFAVSSVLKVLSTILLIILLSLSRSFVFIIIVNVYLLVLLSMMQAEQIIKILKISFIGACFTFVIMLPAVFWGNYYSVVMITPKVFAAVMAVNILSYSTPWHDITGALKSFRIPDIFIFVLDITIKYILLLGEFALNMLYALKLRSVGKNKNKYTSLGGVAGTMFIKSKEMSEDMYAAMQCRGFTGEYRIYKKFKFSFIDLAFVLINVAMILVFIYLRKA